MMLTLYRGLSLMCFGMGFVTGKDLLLILGPLYLILGSLEELKGGRK